MSRRLRSAQLFAALLCCWSYGCADNSSGRASFGPGNPSSATMGVDTEGVSETTSSGATTAPTQATEATSVGVSDGTSTSGGAQVTTANDPIVPCIGVDVLFVVDNSIGMAPEQIRLRSTAYSMLNMLVPLVPSAVEGVNIAVVTTDESDFVVPLGAGNVPMPYLSGKNFMVWDPKNLELQNELMAALSVGEGGDPNERPMDMLIDALTGDAADPGGFNDEFLREDALLVVVLVSDEEDDIEQPTLWGSAGEPSDWVAAIGGVKGDIRKDVVVLSVVPSDSQCVGEADADAPRLGAFAEGFPNAAVEDVCEPEYATFLLGSVGMIAAACEDFSPP